MNKNDPDEKVITIIFHFENGWKCPIATFKRCGLRDVFNLVLVQLGDNDYSFDLRRSKFVYMAEVISKYFLNNEKVSSLKLKTHSIIEVYRLGNLK